MKKITLFTVFLFIALISTLVYAEPSATLNLTSEKTTLKSGDEVKISLTAQLSDIDKISAYTALLEFDTNIFENATENTVTSNTNTVVFNPSNNKFSVSGSNVAETILLKVRENITVPTTTTVSIKNFVGMNMNMVETSLASQTLTLNIIGSETDNSASNNNTEINNNTNSENSVDTSDNSINNMNNNITTNNNINNITIDNVNNNSINNNIITIKEPSNSIQNNSVISSSNNVTNSFGNTSNSTTNQTSNNSINSSANTKLPKTGVFDFALYLIIIPVVAAIVFAIKYHKVG